LPERGRQTGRHPELFDFFTKARTDIADFHDETAAVVLSCPNQTKPRETVNMKQNKLKSGCKKVPCALVVPMVLAAGVAIADDAPFTLPANVDREFLEKLVNKVNSDEAQLKDLKSQIALKNGDTASVMPAGPTYPNLQFHGFADVDYHYSTRNGINNASGVPYNPPATRAGNSFYLGEFDLFLQSQLAENLSVLSEDVISAGTDNHTGIDIERLQLTWKPSEYFNVDFGRFHTQMGYYNTAYHHGTWFQNAVNRPSFLEFEDSGGLLPVHSVGLSIHGAVPSGGLNLSYYLEVANGENYATNGANPVQNVFDNNNNKSINFGLIAKPDWFPGGQFGVGAYHDTVNPVGLPRTDEWIWNAHVVWHSAVWELMAEGFLLRHHVSGEDSHYSPMFYVQAARKFGKYTPYARFTYANASANDQIYTTILNQGGLHYGPSIGLRYDLSTYVALKLQYDYAIDTGYSKASELTFQAAFSF
jgi:hypothetical protein